MNLRYIRGLSCQLFRLLRLRSLRCAYLFALLPDLMQALLGTVMFGFLLRLVLPPYDLGF